MSKSLLIIDLQKQFADKNNGNRCYNKCLDYIKEHKSEYSNIVATLFKQDDDNTNFQNHLNWDGCKNASCDDLEFYNDDIADIVIITKNGYGDASEEQFLTHSCFKSDEQIDIIGCDADACVMAICFQLWDAGFKNIRILTDYIYTTADELYGITRETWINMMRRNFGNCVIIPKRRISFDALFIAPNEFVEYNNEKYEADIAIYFEYKLDYGNGEEVYLENDIQGISSAPCIFSIDKESGYKMDYKDSYSKLYCVDAYPTDAYLWKDCQTPVRIPFKDAVQLLKDNYDIYNNTNNYPAQSTAYSIREIED